MDFAKGDDLSLNCFTNGAVFRFQMSIYKAYFQNYEDLLEIDIILKGPLLNFIAEGQGPKFLKGQRPIFHFRGAWSQIP